MFPKIFVTLMFLCASAHIVQAQPASPQTVGGVSRQQDDAERVLKIEKRLRQKTVGLEGVPASAGLLEDPEGVLVYSIKVEGVTLLTTLDIERITAPYQGHRYNIAGLQVIADKITDAYRKKGYITSRAYLPVQAIKDDTLLIKVLEVKTGNIEVRGNKYFKTELFKKKLDVQPGGHFDFSALQRSMVFINEHPDRLAKAVLVPGKEPGTTDVIVQVADQRPIHVGFEYNNYASRFLNKNQYAMTLEHNNLSGRDDLLYLKFQTADRSRLFLEQLRYLYPLSQRWDVGFYAVNSDLELGKEFAGLDATGNAQQYGLFATRKLVKTSDVDLRFNVGFDYKSVRNKFLGIESSHDELRILKAGFDLDLEDKWGRNILTAGINSGLPDVLGASEAKDPSASRLGAGGRFDKGDFNFFRLQELPFSTSLLWKNIAQFSNHDLVASEQFQMGGASSVRGYSPAEYAGDSGIYSALELSIPFYFISRTMRVPFTRDEKLYNDLKFVVFYDVATAHLNNTLSGQEADQTLRGYGFGVRLNVRENLTCRVEVGYPHGKKPADGDSHHTWVEFTAKY